MVAFISNCPLNCSLPTSKTVIGTFRGALVLFSICEFCLLDIKEDNLFFFKKLKTVEKKLEYLLSILPIFGTNDTIAMYLNYLEKII